MAASPDPMLVVGLVLLMVVMLVINVYILAYWQHPEEKNNSYLARLFIIYGLQLCAVSVLMLPVDVANNDGNPSCDSTSLLRYNNAYCGGIDMLQVWKAFFCMIAFSVVVFIPFATFYYESEPYDIKDMSRKRSRFWPAFLQEVVVITFFMALLLGLYFTKSYALLPIQQSIPSTVDVEYYNYTREVGSSPYSFLDLTLPSTTYNTNHTATDEYIVMPLDFSVYVIGLFSWIAWWMFALFVGVGLASMPFDLIVAYIWRPKVLAPDALANKELELQEKCNDLLEITSLLKRDRLNLNDGSAVAKRAMKLRYLNDRMEVNKLTQMVFILERDLEEYRSCKDIRKGYNPLRPYLNLGMGILFAVLSLLWFLQIVLAMLSSPPASPFLSLYLNTFDVWFPMFGNLTYALFSLYLLACTIKGCFKLSVRFLCCKLHPMQVGATYLNAFLFNLGITMTCTLPLVHFCTVAFEGYTVNSDVYFLFAVQVDHINFFDLFFQSKLFIWIILLTMCGLLPYLFYRPRDVAINTEDFRRKLHERSAADYDALGQRDKKLELTAV